MSWRKKLNQKKRRKCLKHLIFYLCPWKALKNTQKTLFSKKVQNLSKTGRKTLCNLSIFFLRNILVVLNKYNSYSSDGKNWLLHQNRFCQKNNFFTSIFSTFKIHYCWNFFTIRPTKNLRKIWTIDNKSLIRN